MDYYDIRRFGLILALQSEIEAMKAENEIRKHQGLAPAYGEDQFYNKAEEIRSIVYSPNEKL